MIDKCVVNASPLILLAKIGRLALLSDVYTEELIASNPLKCANIKEERVNV